MKQRAFNSHKISKYQKKKKKSKNEANFDIFLYK